MSAGRNDKLLSVDGQNVFDLSPSEVGKLLLGEEGTKVTVKLQTVGSEEPAKVGHFESPYPNPTLLLSLPFCVEVDSRIGVPAHTYQVLSAYLHGL